MTTWSRQLLPSRTGNSLAAADRSRKPMSKKAEAERKEIYFPVRLEQTPKKRKLDVGFSLVKTKSRWKLRCPAEVKNK